MPVLGDAEVGKLAELGDAEVGVLFLLGDAGGQVGLLGEQVGVEDTGMCLVPW